MSGGQIDGEGNINLVGAGGTYPRHNVRWSGSFGSAYLYYLVPRVILFREEHTRRVMVPKVDFISAPGPRADGVYRPGGPIGLLTNLCWFSFDKTYLKALPDWSILYEIHISSIEFASPWGRHLVLLSRLTFDYILLQGLFRLLAIRATIREAVAVVRTDPDVAVRVGSRAVAALIDKLSDPDRAVRGAAANALTQIGDSEGLRQMSEAIHGAAKQS